MPLDKYLEVLIGGEQVDLKDPENIISLSYKFEDKENFQIKQASQAFGIAVPATRNNDQIGNTYHNPSIEDLTSTGFYREPRPAIIRAGGIELLRGKAFLKSAEHDTLPTQYEYDLYGNNGDWIIDLKETTLFDFVSHIAITFSKANIVSSWAFDGTDEDLPYVFAPVRYGQRMDTAPSLVDGLPVDDYNMFPEYMKPSLSKYWLIYWGFKFVGYTVKSDFFDSEYFRRQVMPWTWGAFLDSDGTRMEIMKFLAKSREQTSLFNTDYNDRWDVKADNDTHNGAFDNGDVYEYVDDKRMQWTYPTTAPANTFGPLNATFHINVFIDAEIAGPNVQVHVEVYWYKNGVQQGGPTDLVNISKSDAGVGTKFELGNFDDFRTFLVEPGDQIGAEINVVEGDSTLGRANVTLFVDAFEVSYFRIPLGGTIQFENLFGFKQFKFLDFLGGVIDEFNLAVQTDSVNKAVYFEPTHPYAIGNDLSDPSGGYFAGKMLDWTDKQDLSKKSKIENYSDSERELIFKYKDDQNDGGLKKTQDRNNNKLALAKYVFTERFKAGKKEIENRFFSPTIHYEPVQWKFDDLDPPQMVLMAPENIANVSAGEAQNTLTPKSCYYKGLFTDWKWVFDNDNTSPYPYMFAVNYKLGGEEDPILSYADENVGTDDVPVIGKGLLRRFFLQRMAIIQNGQYYLTWFKLNNNDVSNFLHREHIICCGQKWELLEIINYNPMNEETTQVLLRKWSPIVNAE